jgi:ribosomal protein S18 acetylase RimI-like enzyme
MRLFKGWETLLSATLQVGRAVRDYYVSRNYNMSLWVGPSSHPSSKRDSILEAAGFRRSDEEEVGMAAALSTLVASPSPHPPPTDLQIVAAKTAALLHDFGEVLNSIFPPPPYHGYTDLAAWFAAAAPQADLESPSCPYRAFVGYLDGKPVASGSLFLGAGVAGIYDIATKPEYQRRGYAGLMMETVLDEARNEGYKTAVLEASLEGKSVYKRLGFAEAGLCEVWNLA